MKRVLLGLILLAAPLLASADPFTAITVDTQSEHLELFLNDDKARHSTVDLGPMIAVMK